METKEGLISNTITAEEVEKEEEGGGKNSWKTILPTNNMKPQQTRKQEMNSADLFFPPAIPQRHCCPASDLHEENVLRRMGTV